MSISSNSNQQRSTAYSHVGNSSRSSSFVNVSTQGTIGSRTIGSGIIVDALEVLSLATDTGNDSQKAKAATEEKTTPSNVPLKRLSDRNKKPEKHLVKELDTLQTDLIKLLNVLLLNEVTKLHRTHLCSEDKVIISKEHISKEYASNFVPRENNKRSYSNTIKKIRENISKARQKINASSKEKQDNDYDFTQADQTNLSPKEIIESHRFKKEDFYEKGKSLSGA